jgi:hypothetical protein
VSYQEPLKAALVSVGVDALEIGLARPTALAVASQNGLPHRVVQLREVQGSSHFLPKRFSSRTLVVGEIGVMVPVWASVQRE